MSSALCEGLNPWGNPFVSSPDKSLTGSFPGLDSQLPFVPTVACQAIAPVELLHPCPVVDTAAETASPQGQWEGSPSSKTSVGDLGSDPIAGFAGTHLYADALIAPAASTTSATPSVLPDNAGNTLATARNIGTLSVSQSFSDWVGSTDTNDYYRFDLAQASSFTLSLTGLSADADVQLLNSSGGVLASSANGGSSAEAIRSSLNAGIYYVRVYPYSGSTSYALSVSATATPPSPGYSTTNGYGEASAERAIERLLNVSIPDRPNQFDPRGGLYGLDRIGAPEAWSYGFTGAGIVVAVCDTGVDRSHFDLDANIWWNTGEIEGNGIDDDGNGYVDDRNGWNFANNTNNTMDVQGHGTHVAGTIAAENNGFGVTGVAYNAKIMPVKVLGDNGSGTWESVANGIRYAANNGANVINLSLGGGGGNLALESAVQYAWERGVAVIMAAGNEGLASPGYPAAYAARWGMAIGAVDSSGSLASFSNRAGSLVLDYVTAAGVSVTSTTPNNGYATYSGTSMATPHMAGAMALLMQANRESGRQLLSVGQLEQLFIATASNILATSATSPTISPSGSTATAAATSGGASQFLDAALGGPPAAEDGATNGHLPVAEEKVKTEEPPSKPFTGSAGAEPGTLWHAGTFAPGASPSSPSSSPSLQGVAIGPFASTDAAGQSSGRSGLEAFVSDLLTPSTDLSRRNGRRDLDPLSNLWDLFNISARGREVV